MLLSKAPYFGTSVALHIDATGYAGAAELQMTARRALSARAARLDCADRAMEEEHRGQGYVSVDRKLWSR